MPGPANVQECFEWAPHQLERHIARAALAGEDLLASMLDRPPHIVLTTTYSGLGSAELAAGMVQTALKAKGVEVQLRCYSATDYNSLCRKTCMHLANPPEHVFGDIMSWIPPGLARDLRDMQTEQLEKCKAEWTTNRSRKTELLAEHGRCFRDRAIQLLREHQWDPNMTSYCYKCKRSCRLAPPDNISGRPRVHIEVSGHTCLPWSAAGSLRGWLSPEALPSLVWMFVTKAILPDHIINECTPRFDHSVFHEIFQGLYTVSPACFCPTQLGIPVQRMRKYTHLKLASLPEMRTPVNLAVLTECAFRTMELDGHVFFCAPEKDVRAYNNEVAIARSLPPRGDNQHPYRFCSVTSVSNRDRIARYMALAVKSSIDHRNLLLNITQNAGYTGVSTNGFIPALMRRSLIYSTKHKRALLPLEHFAVQGLPLFTPAAPNLGLPEEYLRTLSSAQLRHLAGNAMALSQVGSILFLVLLHGADTGSNSAER